jgi:hypothetical protein
LRASLRWPARKKRVPPDNPLSAFRSPSEIHCVGAAAGRVSPTDDNLPCGLSPLRRLPDAWQPLIPRGTIPRVRALSAFLTLSGLYSTRHLPALFHAGPALGVAPFKAEIHSRSRTSSRRSLPSCGLPTVRPPSQVPWRRRVPGRGSSQPWRQMTALRTISPTAGLCSP